MKLPYPPMKWPVISHAPMGFGANGEDDTDVEDDLDEGDEEESQSQQPSAEEIAEQRALERQARAQGWRPKDEFKADGNNEWVDAATFLERGAKFKKNMQRQIDQLTAARAKDAKTLEQFKKFHEEAMAAKERDLENAIRKARLDRQEAIRNGEDEEALALDDRIDTLKEEKAKLKAAPAKDDDDEPEAKLPHEIEEENRRKARAVAEGKEPLPPAMQEWLDDGNTWFRDNARMRGYALAIGDELRAAGDKSMDREFLDKVTAQMHEDFPEFFKKKPPGNPLRQRAGAVESGGARGNGEAPGRTIRDLPKEDRDLMRKFVKEGLMTEEAFLKNYRWDK